MKKLISPILIILLLVLSFYYTNKSVSVLKYADPIMKEIKRTEKKYKVEAKNAQVIGNNIISGKNGKTIDYETSYNKMKRYGTYNESLTTLTEVTPTITIANNYDKYVVGGNRENRNIALVFVVSQDKQIENILRILKSEYVEATFFVDGAYLEKNVNIIKNMSKHEVEILSYNDSFDETFIKTSISYLETITEKECKYCYTLDDNSLVLNLCGKLKLHTIKPTIYLDKDIYRGIKNNLANSIIVSLGVNNNVEKELATSIKYIRSKGYNLVSIDELIREDS